MATYQEASESQSEGNFHIVSNRTAVQWLTGFNYGFDIPNDFAGYAELKRWCLENCEDIACFYIRRLDHRVEEFIYFYQEIDAVAYKLRWSE